LMKFSTRIEGVRTVNTDEEFNTYWFESSSGL
jgi:hypothetical protein